MAGRLDGKVSVITGAGSGIGRASALCFAAEGAAVLANDLDESAAEQTARAIREAGGRGRARPGDVTQRAQIDAVVEAAVHEFGRLDVMYNNAGGAFPTPMSETDDERYRHDVALNLDGVWYGTKAALEVMVPQGSGCILTTSSGAGLGAVPGLAPYGAAKAGVIALMRSVALEYGPRGIRANVISPGLMGTPGMFRWLDTLPGGREDYAAQIPLGRLGTAEDIANAALFLASDEASFISGAVLTVDGATAAVLASPRTD